MSFLQFLRQLRIVPVFTPTNASWLNLIEAQFGVTKRFTLTDTDDPDHPTRRRRIARYIRYRNGEADCPRHPLTRMLSIRDIKLERHLQATGVGWRASHDVATLARPLGEMIGCAEPTSRRRSCSATSRWRIASPPTTRCAG